jgi:acyl dehydratase
MPEDNNKLELEQLEEGYEFAPADYRLDPSMVTSYIEAVGEDDRIFHETDTVPPMAIAALALTSLMEAAPFPEGTIHVSQEFDFINTASTKDTLTRHARITSRRDRGRLRMMTISLSVHNHNGKPVLKGETSLLLP